ncbi:hypothetical protein Taro_039648 [Colocasia esculenta]|uniref:Uncharacterized protein n=1 Tax=Colocasia esculenta TaxID=4460 RepID=A0A843W9U9_COLES|nr:hypothetical protein [Colocasia esculenta]
MFLGFRHDSRFIEGLVAFLRVGYGSVLVFSVLDISSELASRCVMSTSSVVVRRLFRNASLVGYPRFFVSQALVFVVLEVLSRYLCCTVEVCVVFLDTLTLEFELYVRLRERRQWGSDFPEFVLLSLFEVCPGVGTVVVAVVV